MSEEQAVRKALAEIYTDEGIEIFMTSRNRLLDMRCPIDLVREGDTDRLFAYIDAMAEGVFT